MHAHMITLLPSHFFSFSPYFVWWAEAKKKRKERRGLIKYEFENFVPLLTLIESGIAR